MKLRLYYYTAVKLDCQIKLNRFHLRPGIEFETDKVDTLFGLLQPPQQVGNQFVQAVVVDNPTAIHHRAVLELHGQISDHASIYLHTHTTNLGETQCRNPIMYFRQSNFTSYCISVGYEYKNFCVEYNLFSNYLEPQVRARVFFDFPLSYFKDIFSTSVQKKHITQINTELQAITYKEIKVNQYFTLPTVAQVTNLNEFVLEIENSDSEADVNNTLECKFGQQLDAVAQLQDAQQTFEKAKIERIASHKIVDDTFVLPSMATRPAYTTLTMVFMVGLIAGVWCKKPIHALLKWLRNKWNRRE